MATPHTPTRRHAGFWLALCTLSCTLHAGNFTANFNDRLLPAGTQIFGNDPWLPVIESGGVDDSPCLKLTRAVNSQYGSFLIEDLDAGAPVYGIRASFMARIGAGTAVPADGWSFCVAPDLPDGTWGETGAGTGLTVQFDTYDNTDGDPNNGTGEAPQIRLAVGGQIVATTPLLPLGDLIDSAFVPVDISLNPDGTFDLLYNGKAHFNGLFFPGYQPLSGVRIGIGARTGGLNANHFIDDLRIETFLVPEPGIVQAPRDQTVIEGSPAVFGVTLNNGDGALLQWLRNGAPITGATGLAYTLSATTPADHGATFAVRVTLGSTTVTSPAATLSVVRLDLPAAPVLSFNFNDGVLPAGTDAYGAGNAADGFSPWWPYVSPNGGVGDSGVLQITEAVNDQNGTFLIPDPHGGVPVYGVAARFDLRIGGGTAVPADGLSFNFANDLPDATIDLAEEGAGSGLRVCFDIYDNTDGNPNNAAGEAPAITLKWNGAVVGEARLPLSDLVTSDAFADVIVRLTTDGNLDVAWNGKVLLYRAPVPGFGSVSNGRFGFYGRTGGLNANQWIDNLRLYTYLSAPLRISRQPDPATVLVGKTATFQVEVTTPAGATYRWFRNGTAIPGATDNAYTTPPTTLADHGARFKAEVTLGGSTVASAEAGLTVVDLVAPSNPRVSYPFNSGLPTGTDIGGTFAEGGTPVAFIDTVDGVDGSGVLKLTTSENSQAGGFRSALIEGGAQLLDITFAADVLAGNGTAAPADGFSINLGNDLPIIAPGEAENGAGNGLTIAFDTYDNVDANPNNEAGEAPSIDVRYGGQVVATQRVPLALVNAGVFQTVLFRVRPTGQLDLAVGDTVVYQGLLIPGYAPMSGVRIACYARTGGANASYWFDNIRLGATLPASVSITIEPSDALVLAGQTATFQVQASNPQGVTYQWRRDGTPIPGATQASYTTPALTIAEDGVGFSAVVTGPGNTITSRTAIAGVMATFDAGANPVINLNFNDAVLPAEGALFGSAIIQPAGGVGDSAFVQLTEAVNDQNGAFHLNTPAGAAPIRDLTATWRMRVGGGTAAPADGCSFVLGEDIGDGTFGEDGAGSGLIVSFDTYDNGTAEVAPEISIRYRGNSVATRAFDLSVLRTDAAFAPIGVRINNTGTLDLYYDTTAVYRGLVLPGFTPFGAGRFAWGARTGGLNDNHWIDDVRIALNLQGDLGPTLNVSTSGGNCVITWTGSGTLQSTVALPGGWSDVAGATSGYTTTPSGTARYFRVRQ